MTLKTCLSATALFALTATTALADKIPLADLSRYLNDLKTAKGAFTQINDDGTLSTGTITIKRPGRMSFIYNPPDDAMVLVSGGAVVIHDPKSNQPPQTYPLRRTPLSIVLAKDVDLARARMVTAHEFDGTATLITAQDPEHPEYGNIQLAFTPNPVELRQWIINDDAGSRTTVILGEMQHGGDISEFEFDPATQIPELADNQ